MKRMFFCLLMIAFCSLSFAQTPEKYDVILKTNGEEMIGSVKAISDEIIDFVYQNETVDYKVKTTEIVKITFASGRVQFLNNFDSNKKPVASIADHHNKVAILPFAFIKDQDEGSDAMSSKIQEESYVVFSKYSGGLEFQEPRKTNALLIKAGVTNNNINGFTMGEICDILAVEFAIQGTVTIQKTTQSNFNSVSTTSKGSGSAYVNNEGKVIGNIFGSGKQKSTSFGASTNVQNYSTSIAVNIYNDKGNIIFSQDHASFWNTQDAYKITLKYLAKRSPFYKK